MVDQLRLYLHRPLKDGDRPRLFAGAVAVIAAGVAVLSLLDDAGPSQGVEGAPRPAPAPSAVAPSGPSAHAVAPPAVAPSEEGLPTAAAEASRADVAAAKRAGRRFLTGYLAFTYDRGPVRAIRRADPALERRLARHPPRVPSRERARHPRVRLLQGDGVSRKAASLVALVDDGARRYTLALGLARTGSGWMVTSVGS